MMKWNWEIRRVRWRLLLNDDIITSKPSLQFIVRWKRNLQSWQKKNYEKKLDWKCKRSSSYWANWTFWKIAFAFAFYPRAPLLPIPNLIVDACIRNPTLHLSVVVQCLRGTLDHKDIPIKLNQDIWINPLLLYFTFPLVLYSTLCDYMFVRINAWINLFFCMVLRLHNLRRIWLACKKNYKVVLMEYNNDKRLNIISRHNKGEC